VSLLSPLPSSLPPSSFCSALAGGQITPASVKAVTRSMPPCGHADRRRRGHRVSDSPADWPELDLRYDLQGLKVLPGNDVYECW
jgi:hypothetical protein